MAMNAVSGWHECQDSLSALLTSDEPVLVGRMGGSDTDAIIAMIDGAFTNEIESRAAALTHWAKVKRFNGYYDVENSDERYFEFLKLIQSTYLATKHIAFVDSKLLTLYFAQNLNPIYRLDPVPFERAFRAFVGMIDDTQGTWNAYPYTFYQTLTGNLNLFRVFENVLRGKRVMVASPFTASIVSNWANRRGFLKAYDYPDFMISYLDTPVTYDGLPASMYPHDNWFQTLDQLKQNLSDAEFDVLLLSCGSYAMPLGLHARDELGKKAVYCGGILQLFFGIMGRRYDNPFFLDAINPSVYIRPIERETFLEHVKVDEGSPKEAFGAYF